VEGLAADLANPSLAMGYTANSQNQYSLIDPAGNPPNLALTYDVDGNATAYPLPADPSQLSNLTWNAENRLISVTVAGVTTAYTYDFQGRRITKQTGTGPITRYIYEGWNLIAEYTDTTLERTYTWGLDLSGSMQGAGGVGGLLAVHVGSDNYYPTYDGNGNVSEYLTATGTVAAHFEYDAFGNDTVATIGSGAPEFAHRFSTKPLDAESGLHYYGYRYYAPGTGQWIGRDPSGESGGINLFGFLRNATPNGVDALGLSSEFHFYGRYGGPGWTNGRKDPGSMIHSSCVGPPCGPPPKDDEDACYMKHDINHKLCKENWGVKMVTIKRRFWFDKTYDCNEETRVFCTSCADDILSECLARVIRKGMSKNPFILEAQYYFENRGAYCRRRMGIRMVNGRRVQT
jgi:RHS repeat-associated protein